ncbi:MAG: PilZ domain-containing protein [Candidatus Omnitrophica bacterium]|nr:PilZ domain-containing protein [Candidatus Omnitrophota bacterium]
MLPELIVLRKNLSRDKRRYIRLLSVFPVDFRILDSLGAEQEIQWQQGYTCNVSAGGLCLETVSVDKAARIAIEKELCTIQLRMHIPLRQKPIEARSKVVWKNIENEGGGSKYYLGLHFTEIADTDAKKLIGRAKWIYYSGRFAFFMVLILVLTLLGSWLYINKLRSENRTVIAALVRLQEEFLTADNMYRETKNQKLSLSKERGTLGKKDKDRIKALDNQYDELTRRLNRQADYLDILTRKKEGLQKNVVDKMYVWLKSHQSRTTGLVLSFEGKDTVIKDWAFIYDQALAVGVFLLYDDFKSAREVLNFFNRVYKDNFGGFNNAYFYDSGTVSEYTVHCGPNIWVGIAALQYLHKVKDDAYLPLAEKIADWLISIQEGDPAGGLKGGPGVFWFATEHNLDAFAFFKMLYDLTGKEKYKIAKDKARSWLNSFAMVPHDADYKKPPVNRGRGDATIATDTYAWSLAALGPAVLSEMKMDPEKIMAFAEENCAVEVKFKRPSGAEVAVKGFDFSKAANIPRGGVVSPEWTSQMIISYRMLSRYFKEENNGINAEYYSQKAQFYLGELNKLIISSPSPIGRGEGCLPYATAENSDTGHGWNTPDGNNTCSVAGTAYMIMAIKDFNPLVLNQEDGLKGEHR